MAGPFDFLRNNSSGLTQLGLGLLSGRTGQEQAAMGAQGLAGAVNQNKTVQWLQKTNPDLAAAVQQGAITPGDAWKMAYTQRLEAAKPKNNFITAGKNLYNVETGQWVAPPAGIGGDDAEYGLNPQYGVDANGNPVIVQLSKSGTSKQTALPDGVTLSKQPIKLDAGTHFVLLDPITRQPIGQIEKDVAGTKREQEIGVAQAEAQTALPGARDMAKAVSEQVESLKTDPYLPNMLGPWDSRTPDITADAARVSGKMEQLQSGAFLSARQLLKGGGAITDYEGKKAEAAFARLNRAQSDEDYKTALDEFNYWVQQGITKLERQAGQGGAQSPAPARTGSGTTGSGVKWSVE